MIYNIYGLVSPIDGQVVYIGVTSHSVDFRVKQHYWHLNEVNYGRRNNNKRFEYLKSILPLKVTGILLKQVDDTTSTLSIDFWEKYYIDKYFKINPNLLNETDGGRGGNTYKYKNDTEIKTIGEKISRALKGKPKSKKFADNLSTSRKGLGNPGTKKLNEPIYAVNYISRKKLKKVFYYGFEINEFLNKGNAWSNVRKAINHINRRNGSNLDFQVCYGYYWLTKEYADNYEFM